MSVGFGFSVGDFISAIELVGTVIGALRSSGSADTDYRELVSQLLSLQTALLQVKGSEFEDAQYAEEIALRQAAALCQRTIDGFWERVKGYQPHLGNDEGGFEGSRINLKDKMKRRWMKVKWAVCKKEDVRKFQADLVGHTESIQLLLVTLQMGKSNLQGKKQEERQQSLAGRIQEGYFNCMQKLVAVTHQGKQLLEITTTILRTNVQVFQTILQIQRFITTIPAQVERQEPVYLLDALGRTSPFHLEFVRSPEALVAVLKVNFKKHGKGAEKIERGEFAIEDTATRRDVNLQDDWETCFAPGQRVNMSMIFKRDCPDYIKRRTTCPKCHQDPGHRVQLLADSDVTCTHCGTTFRRGVDVQIIENELDDEPEEPLDSGEDSKKLNFQKPLGKTPQPVILSRGVKRKAEEDELADFKRVRVFDIVRVESSAGGPKGQPGGYGLSQTKCIPCRVQRVECDRNMPHCLRCERLGATCYGYSEDLPGTSEEMAERTGDAVSRQKGGTDTSEEEKSFKMKQRRRQLKDFQREKLSNLHTGDGPHDYWALDELKTPKRSKTSRRSRQDTKDEPKTPKRSETGRRSRQDTKDEPRTPKRSGTGRRSGEGTLNDPRTPKRSETDRWGRWEIINSPVSEEREDSLKYGGIGKEAWLKMGGMSRGAMSYGSKPK